MKKSTRTAEKRRKLDELRRKLEAANIPLAARRLKESIKEFRDRHEMTREALDLEISL